MPRSGGAGARRMSFGARRGKGEIGGKVAGQVVLAVQRRLNCSELNDDKEGFLGKWAANA